SESKTGQQFFSEKLHFYAIVQSALSTTLVAKDPSCREIATFNSAPVAGSSFGIALPRNLLPFPMAGCSIMNDCLDMDDRELLTEYATRNSEDAFRTLVERHAGFVYHTALRQVGNHHQVEEITQAVFIALARKAARISANTVIPGWLFRATRYAIANHLRSNTRRQRY